ncbi:unnamed protein product [Closterium sp. NIES-54]
MGVGQFGEDEGGVAAVRPAAPVARETVAPVVREPVVPVAREPVAPVARPSRPTAPFPPVTPLGPSRPEAPVPACHTPRPLDPRLAPSATTATTTAATAATAAPAYCATMASLRVLALDHEGRPVQFDTWLDDLQLYLLNDIKDGVSLFDHVSGAATAPPTTADSATRSPWLSCDAAARLAIRNHLPLAECAHFGQHRTARALYDAVVARYSSPATAALGRLLLPYLFPELSAYSTVEDLVSHLCASDARYRAAVPAEFLDNNQPPIFITLYFILTRLPDSLRSVLLVALRAPPSLRGAPPSPLAPSYASAAAADVSVAEDVRAASASAKRRSGKGKAGKGGGAGSGDGGGGSGSGGGGSSGGGGGGGTGGGSGGSGGGGGGSSGSGGGGSSGTGGGGFGARHAGSGGSLRQQQQRRSETQSPQQLREWFLRGASGGSCPYVIRTGDCAGQTCGRLHTQHRCFSCLDDAWRAEFGDDVKLPRWADLLSAEGDCYRCVPPDTGMAAAALGASESGTLPSTAPAQALHTFTLDSGASTSFFHDSTALTPLSTPVPVRLADPSGGPVVARSSTVLPCPAVPSGSLSRLHFPSFFANLVSTAALQDAMVTTTTPGGQRVTICTCTQTGRHLTTFTRRPGSSLYTLAIEPPQVAASAQVSASGQLAASCSCRLLSHQTLLWHHRLGHPTLPRLRGMHSRLLVSGLPMSLPPLPPSPAPPCLPCVEGRQRATPHSSSFPPTTAPLQTLHIDVRGPAHVSGQSRERYFLLVVDDYTRYTTVFPLCSKGQVVDVLIPWICTVRLQLRERFGKDLPVLRLHSHRGVMEVARTSMIHAAAPHFLWPFAVRYAAHQLNLWPHVSLPETSLTLRWMGEVGDASVFRVWGSRAFVRDTSPDKLSARAIPCVFLGFPPNTSGWQFYHPTSRGVFPSQDITFDESVPLYHLFPYRSAPPPPPPLFHAPGPPPSSLPAVPDPKSDRAHAASPTVSRLLATVVTDPSFESTAVSALVAELVDFAAAYRQDYATALVADSESASPPFVGGGCALGTDVLEVTQEDFECLAPAVPRFASMLLAPEGDLHALDIPTPRSYAEAITGPYSSLWQAAMDAEMASWKSTGTYVDKAPPLGANIVDVMWIFRVKRPPGSPPAFKARYVARGFSQ